jgi:predicted nucleic acid-binding protein
MAKEKIICDTDVMIDYFDAASARHAATKEILDKKIELDNIWLSAITKMELLTGAANKTALSSINKKLTRFNIFLLTNEITITALSLFQGYRLSHGLAIPDGLSAATAIESELRLFTYNVRDFKFITGIRLYK